MTRRHWRNLHTSPEQYYGLGTISGTFLGWDWFGHSGGLQGYISRTCVYPSQELAVCVLTNAIDGWAHLWVDGMREHPAGVRAQRRANSQDKRLERTLVDAVGCGRSRADGQQGAVGVTRLHQRR